jgi:hypothetical protein
MNQRETLRQMIPLLLAALLLTAIVLVINFGDAPAIPMPFFESRVEETVGAADRFDYERAADIAAYRWLAMAHWYDEQGLSTRATFDYAAAGDLMAYRWLAMAAAYERDGLLRYHDNPDDLAAYRWLAMARFYKAEGMLTRDTFDYAAAADLTAYRWQAMAAAQEQYGLLRYHDNPDDLAAYRWLAMARWYDEQGLSER